jgi:hypothetical protein
MCKEPHNVSPKEDRIQPILCIGEGFLHALAKCAPRTRAVSEVVQEIVSRT